MYGCIFEDNTDRAFTLKNVSAIFSGVVFKNSLSPIAADSSSLEIRYSTFDKNYQNGEGGGISCSNGSTKINNSIFNKNSSQYSGGALFLSNSSIQLNDCEFFENSSGVDGGAISSKNSSLHISSCEFINNSSDSSGGAICSKSDHLQLNRCKLVQNTSKLNGGAISFEGNPGINKLAVIDCDLHTNRSNVGGAIFAVGNNILEIIQSYFYDNYADSGASTIHGDDIDSTEVVRNLFVRNLSNRGSLMNLECKESEIFLSNILSSNTSKIELLKFEHSPNSYFMNNTLVGNYSTNGLLIKYSASDSVFIIDNIFWGNLGIKGINGLELQGSQSRLYRVENNCFQGILRFFDKQQYTQLIGLSGNINVDPSFIQGPKIWVNKVANGPLDLRLDSSSICIDRGSAANIDFYKRFGDIHLKKYLFLDNDAKFRVFGSRDEIGAYEVRAKPRIEIDLVPTTLCEGSGNALHFHTNRYDTARLFNWYKNGQLIQSSTSDFYYFSPSAHSDSGAYQSQACNPYGCVWSKKVYVNVTSFRSPNITGARAFCKGRWAILSVDSTYSSYEWRAVRQPFSLGNNKSLRVFSPDDYYVYVENDLGCRKESPSFKVTELRNPTFSLGPDVQLSYWDSATAIGPVGMFSYVWNKDANNNKRTFHIPAKSLNQRNNLLHLAVVDSNYCTAWDAKKITIYNLSLKKETVNKLLVFPNPSIKSIINIDGLKPNKYSFKVFDITGKIVLEGNSEIMQLDLSTIEKGAYLLSIFQNEDHYASKIIIN